MMPRVTGWGALMGLLLAAGLGSSGCTGYRLGSMLPPGIRTVHVPMMANETGEPFIEGETTRALIDRIQMDGSLRLAREGMADTVLHVTLRDYSLAGITFERGPAGRPDEYRLTLTASLELIHSRTGEIVAEHPAARGETTVEMTGDLSAARRNALPAAAEDLARDIVRRIVEYW